MDLEALSVLKVPNFSTACGETDLHRWMCVSVDQPEGITQGVSPLWHQGEIDLSSSWLQCIMFAVML